MKETEVREKLGNRLLMSFFPFIAAALRSGRIAEISPESRVRIDFDNGDQYWYTMRELNLVLLVEVLSR